MRNTLIVAACALLLAACAAQPPRPPSGEQTYITHCASCHGTLGEGDGPVSAVMLINVPNLRTLNERNAGTFPADMVASYIDGRDLPVAHGDRVMPVWGEVFDTTARLVPDAQDARQRIDAVLGYLRGIQY